MLIVSAQALASWRQPPDNNKSCGGMVKLTKEQKLSRADIVFKGYTLNRKCGCKKSAAHCTISYKPTENYKNTQMDKIYKIDETYTLDFGCTPYFIDDLEKVSEQTKQFFLKQDEGGLTRIKDKACQNAL